MKVKANGKVINTFAFIGNDLTAIYPADDLADELKVDGPLGKTVITTVNGTSGPMESGQVGFVVTSMNEDQSFEMEDVLTLTNLNVQRKPVRLEKLWGKWPHLMDVPIQPFSSGSIKLRIGMGNPALHQVLVLAPALGRYDIPRAHLTPLGW